MMLMVRAVLPRPWRPSSGAGLRCLSSSSAYLLSFFSDWPTTAVLQNSLLHVHHACGCWGLELVACTAVARLLLSTATMTYSRRLFTSYALTMHPSNVQERKFKERMSQELTSGNLPPLMARDLRRQQLQRLRVHQRQLIQDGNVHPGKALVVLGVEAMFWLSAAVAVRNLSAGYPAAALVQEAHQDLSQQGFLWFHDLTQPDPFCVLPVLTAATLLFSVQASRRQPVPQSDRVHSPLVADDASVAATEQHPRSQAVSLYPLRLLPHGCLAQLLPLQLA